MRQVGSQVPFKFVVSPEGRIKRSKYHQNLGGVVRARVFRTPDGSTRMSDPYIEPEYARKGWEFLETLYEKDPREEIREQGYQLYLEYDRQIRARVAGAYELKNRRMGEDGAPGTSEEKRLFARKFPEELLPQEVLARRAGSSAVSGGKFEEPKLAKKGSRGKTPPQANP